MTLKVLIISRSPWVETNSFGNTYTNLFTGMENIRIANIYLSSGIPDNKYVERYFQISEKMLIQNLFSKNHQSGREVILTDFFGNNEAVCAEADQESLFNLINLAQKTRWQIFYWIRDLIWKIGRWKSDELIRFIDEFNPDLIFQPLYYSNYVNPVVLFVKRYTNVPIICYVSDDVYTLRQFSLSPLYWLDRFVKRSVIKRVVKETSLLYVISEIQKKEYEECFGIECKVLSKGYDFHGIQFEPHEISEDIKLVYTGNIGDGRWESLVAIGKALQVINKGHLYIYSQTLLTHRMQKAFKNLERCTFMGAVNSKIVKEVQHSADILVHVESMKLKERFTVRHSISTKILDYISIPRCVLAVGPEGIASIEYLKNNDAACVVTDISKLSGQLSKLLNDRNVIEEYAQKAWECGKKNNDINIIRKMLMNDMNRIVVSKK